MIDYPQKGSHYAHKTFRLMHKAMVAAEYGRDVMCLLAVILHTEDAARYRGPVSFFNTQLMETLGFKKWDQFDAVRAKAVQSGWLQYEGCGKRTPGRYFVTIPEGFEQVDDGLMEECISPKNGYNDGYNDGYKHGYDEGVKVGINRGQTWVQTRVTSYPIPNPDPNPNPENTIPPKSPKGEKSAFDPESVSFPSEIDTPEVRTAWLTWCQHRRELRKRLTPTSVVKQLGQLAVIGPVRAVAMIEHSISKGYSGLYEPNERATNNQPPKQLTLSERLASIRMEDYQQ